MPLPFRSVSWYGDSIKTRKKKSQYPIARTYKYWWSYQIFLTQPEKKKKDVRIYSIAYCFFFSLFLKCVKFDINFPSMMYSM
jgi:hypothetical protein